jgi:hypothetical protein
MFNIAGDVSFVFVNVHKFSCKMLINVLFFLSGKITFSGAAA